MKLDELSYLAGLVDGEGHVAFSSEGRGRQRFVIEIKMTEEHVIDWLQKRFGGAKQSRPSKNAKWKNQWRWRVQGVEAAALYKRIKPLLKIKII